MVVQVLRANRVGLTLRLALLGWNKVAASTTQMQRLLAALPEPEDEEAGMILGKVADHHEATDLQAKGEHLVVTRK